MRRSRPEVAILAVPVNHLLGAVEQCAAAGVGCCVIISTGFAEANEAGAALAAAHPGDRAARRHADHRAELHGADQSGMAARPLLLRRARHGELLPGRIGLISQSGALMVSLFDRAMSNGIGFSGCVSLGNQSDLEICDFLDYFIDDPGPTRSVSISRDCVTLPASCVPPLHAGAPASRWWSSRPARRAMVCGPHDPTLPVLRATTIHSPRSVVHTMSSLPMIR